MIDLYKKYYLDSDKVQQILKSGIIVFDTSALLDLYYYSFDTQNEIFRNVFKYLSNRLWIPSQVYFEYLKNRKKVSEKPISSYKSLITRKDKNDDGGQVDAIVEKASLLLSKNILEIKNQLKTLKEQTINEEKHPYLSADIYANFEKELAQYEETTTQFVEQSKEFKKLISAEIEKRINEIQTNYSTDNVFNAIQDNFLIGKEYNYKQMLEIAHEGEFRYDQQIPPGYEDESNKIGLQKYGDLFAWYQVLDFAAIRQKDFILVTNDSKNDWFDEDKITPRFELLKEFNEKANKSIWLLSMKNFIWTINNLLDEKLNATTLEDVNSLEANKSNYNIQLDLSIERIQELFNSYLRNDLYIIDKVVLNEEIRVFNNPQLYEAEDESGQKYRIVVTVINGANYVRMLHGMTNAFEIRNFYVVNKEYYKFYNLVIISNKGIVPACLEHLHKNKVKKMFNDHSIMTAIGYIEDSKILLSKTNFSEQ